MEEEMDSLRKNETWELVGPSAGQKLVSSKWLFKIKEWIEGVQKPRSYATGRLPIFCLNMEFFDIRGSRDKEDTWLWRRVAGYRSPQDSEGIQAIVKDCPVRDCDVERMSKVS
ncbi:hypothetical protein Tco_1401066 [Tanacetum coccineum]